MSYTISKLMIPTATSPADFQQRAYVHDAELDGQDDVAAGMRDKF